MVSFYFFPYGNLLFMIILIATGVLLQTFLIVISFILHKYNHKKNHNILFETGLLMEFLLYLYIAADACYNRGCNFATVNSWTLIALLLLGINLAAAINCFFTEKRWSVFLVVSLIMLIQPFMEAIFLKALPYVVVIVFVILSIRSIYLISRTIRQGRNTLSPFSMKDVIDSFNFGLLLYSNNGRTTGEIFLYNSRMRELMFALMGKILYNGEEFYNRLVLNEVISSRLRDDMEKLPVFNLPDGRIWQFRIDYIGEDDEYALISASDITEYRTATTKLYEKTRILNRRNKELNEMLDNMEYLCKHDEILRTKGRIHDILGQKISLFLRNLREHRVPDQELLIKFSESLLNELRDGPDRMDYRLDKIVKDFKELGVQVVTRGDFPEDNEVRQILFEITVEALSNAVRHGYANKVWVDVKKTNLSGLHPGHIMTISDNGTSFSGDKIIEGGGFNGMRRKAELLGGSFSYKTSPRFKICISIPDGGGI